MSLNIGDRVGSYEVFSLLGRGGMGEVYRAHDTKLNRDVALKILPPEFTHDPERVARFRREAQVLASLNHPHIGAIYGLEEANGTQFLVLELVEGPTLADRISRGPVPLDEALPIARQIAEALEAAHEKGIIHRDLKPANIALTAHDQVKVLDFGLAKALEVEASGADLANSPTITTPAMTQAGVILGTAAYMSPEQTRGRTVDKRADIWAFGAVLFEMLTGKRAFPGEDLTDTLAAVVRAEPDWNQVPRAVSPTLLVFLRRCLQKDLKQRIGDIHDVRLALEGAFETTVPQTTAMTPSSALRGRLAWIAAFAAAVVIIALAIPAVRYLRETPPPVPAETRLEIGTPPTDQLTSFDLSPDGRQVVFVASGDGASRLWLRSLATTTAQPLSGTEGARFPFWAPDGKSIGFFAGNALKRLDLSGGAPQTLAPVTGGFGGTWSADGVIVFAPGTGMPLRRVSATGGAAVDATTLGTQQGIHVLPHFLPDGRRFLFSDLRGIYLGALDGRAPTRLTSDGSPGWYLPSGWMLWVRSGTLVAQRLNLTRAALAGEPVTLADGVAADFLPAVAVAPTGLVAYRMGAGTQRQLTWVDRSGVSRGTVGDPDGSLFEPRVSPDGRRVVVGRTVQGNQDLWLLDGARTSRLTFDAAGDGCPVWSPDGTRIAWWTTRHGPGDIYQRLASGAGVEERLVASDQGKYPTSWSPDGRFLLYHSLDPQTNADLWVLPMGDRTPSVVLKTPFREAYGTFSPDGRWVAYHSNESGRQEVFVRPFVPLGTAVGGPWQVSAEGGVFPLWRPDGKELYYLNPAGAMMAAPITVTGATLEPGAPVRLFPTRILGGGVDAQLRRQYDVAPDGRFLINTVLDSAASPITLLQNWRPPVKP